MSPGANFGSELPYEDACRILIDRAPLPLWIHFQNRLIYVNDAALELLGAKSQEELVGRSPLDFIAPEFRATAEERITRMAGGEAASVESIRETFLRVDGSPVSVSVAGAAFPYKGGRAIQAHFFDMSAWKRAEQTEARFRATFEQAAVGMAHVGLDGKWLRVNQKLCDIVGYTRDELLTKTFADITHPDDIAGDWTRIDALLRGKFGTYSVEKRYIRKDGALVWINLTVALMCNSDGSPEHFISVIEDISARKAAESELRASQERFQKLFEASPVAKYLIDPVDQSFIMFNNRAPEQLGYTHEELARLHVYELDAQMSREEIQQCFSSNFAGKKLTFETKHRASNGELRDVFITGQAITFEGREVVFASALDITDNKRAEQALREAEQINRHALEQRVEERTRELAEVNRELEAFAYSVSHDLRAPLRSVDGFGKILLRDYPGKVLDDRAAGYIRRMSAATKRMEQLIQDLLNLSRVSRGEFKKQTVDLSSVASSVVAELREADPGRQVRVDIQPGMTCIGDARLLRVALHNLLGNAWKFTSKTADATIEFHSRLEGSDTVYSVRDNGAGFDMAHAEHLFAPFQRLHQTHEFDGTGIGLAIVHRVIGRHGGRVSASGKIGEGATFEFTLGSL